MPKTQAKRGMSPRELDALRKRYVAEQKQADSASKWQLANDIVSGINDIVGRGVIAPILGMPGDINQAIYDAGAFVNNKIKDVEVATGMVKQPRYVRPTQGNAYLGSEDIGNRMQQAGLVSSERRPMTELAASFVSPSAAAKTAINAPKTAMNMLRMVENLEAPSRGVRNAQGMYVPRGQMGAIENLWHGSPYEFDKFSADAREVGFRGDAFGKGAYAAEDVDVAKYFTEHGGGGTGDKGYLYNLRLAYPGEKEAKTPLGAEHFIDWDKPFEQQSQFVRDKITNLDEYDWLQTVNNALENNEGRYLYDAARSDFGGKKEASDALAKAGIPGMRYKEPGKDSYNYVVFDDKLIDIVARNNQPIKKAEAPQAKALREAQINAAKPIEEGGLGLRPDNTPEERAAAMGFEGGWYHGTGADIREMNTEGVGKTAGAGAFVTDNPINAETYVPGLGQSGNIMPLMIKRDNLMEVDAKGRRWGDIRTNDLFHKRKSLVRMFPEDLQYNNSVSTDEIAALAPYAGFDGVVIRNVIDNGPNSHIFRAKEYLQQKYGIPISESEDYWSGVTGAQFAEARRAVEKGYNKKSNIIALQKPENIRSRFAAFDPMRRDSSDILAGLALPIVAAPAVMANTKDKRKERKK